MQVISTNIANPKTINWRGKEIQTGIYKSPNSGTIYLGNEDVKGDHVIDRRYHGGIDKACYLFSEKHYLFWKEKYPKLEWNWGMFGENLTISNLNEAEIFIGDIFEIGNALVQISQPRQPCFKLGYKFGTQKMIKEFVESGHSGIYVRVLKNGEVKLSDEIVLKKKARNSMSVLEVFKLIYSNKTEAEKAKNAIQIESLAISCKNDLKKRFHL